LEELDAILDKVDLPEKIHPELITNLIAQELELVLLFSELLSLNTCVLKFLNLLEICAKNRKKDKLDQDILS